MQSQPHWKPGFYSRYIFSQGICMQYSDCLADNTVSSSREALPRVRRRGWLEGFLLSRLTDGGKSLSMWSVAELLKACCKAGLITALLLADFHLLFLRNDPGAQKGGVVFVFKKASPLHGCSLQRVQLNLKHPNKIIKKKKKHPPLFC